MKTFLLFIFSLTIFSKCLGESQDSTTHSHKDLHLEIAIGKVFGTITDGARGFNTAVAKGQGIGILIKGGIGLNRHLVLTGEYTWKTMVKPVLKYGSSTYDYPAGSCFYETGILGGLTYFALPSDVYCSMAVGVGDFMFINPKKNFSNQTDKGFAYRLSAGKHFWIYQNLGISVGVALSQTHVNANDNQEEYFYPYKKYLMEYISSNRISLDVAFTIH